MFVFYVDTYMARAMCPPRYRAVKKTLWSLPNRNNKIDFFYRYNFKTPQISSTNFSPTPHSLKYGWETNVTLTEVHPASPLGLIVNTT